MTKYNLPNIDVCPLCGGELFSGGEGYGKSCDNSHFRLGYKGIIIKPNNQLMIFVFRDSMLIEKVIDSKKHIVRKDMVTDFDTLDLSKIRALISELIEN
jgi:hypothetical protein